MDEQKIRRFLESVNQGFEVSRQRLLAELDYLEQLGAHLEPLRVELDRLEHGEESPPPAQADRTTYPLYGPTRPPRSAAESGDEPTRPPRTAGTLPRTPS